MRNCSNKYYGETGSFGLKMSLQSEAWCSHTYGNQIKVQGHPFLQGLLETRRERTNRSLNQKQGTITCRLGKGSPQALGEPQVAHILTSIQVSKASCAPNPRGLRAPPEAPSLPGLGANVAGAGNCDTGETSGAGPRTTCSVGREYSSGNKTAAAEAET